MEAQLAFEDVLVAEAPKPALCVLDFETGGLNANINGLASVGVVRLDKDLNEVDRWYSLLWEPDQKYEQSALDVNGLTLDQFIEGGLLPFQFIPKLHELCDGLIMVNHNSQFDCRWLNRLGFNIQESICTMELDYKAYPYQKHKLGLVYQRFFGHSFEGAHNSLSDVEATIEVLRWYANKNTDNLKPFPINWDRFKR